MCQQLFNKKVKIINQGAGSTFSGNSEFFYRNSFLRYGFPAKHLLPVLVSNVLTFINNRLQFVIKDDVKQDVNLLIALIVIPGGTR